ncbi:MAG: hypothetical protein JXB38_21200 [Anaerolineales bacterium]|nr:hypothetical protein [Anaerolineales bacterium]
MKTKLFFLLGVLLLVQLACAIPTSQSDCGPTLDQETLDNLALDMSNTVQVMPGESHQFNLGVVECCYVFTEVDACADWTVTPMEGASISADGLLTVAADATNGSVYTVSADVEDGRRVVDIEVHVFDPQENPLVGLWREQGQYTCADGEYVVPAEKIGELEFRADGRFYVTWQPFELYRDYWGTYTFDLAAGTLALNVEGGNHVPEETDLEGRFSIDADGKLVLEDMWLGYPPFAELSQNCGYLFQ